MIMRPHRPSTNIFHRKFKEDNSYKEHPNAEFNSRERTKIPELHVVVLTSISTTKFHVEIVHLLLLIKQMSMPLCHLMKIYKHLRMKKKYFVMKTLFSVFLCVSCRNVRFFPCLPFFIDELNISIVRVRKIYNCMFLKKYMYIKKTITMGFFCLFYLNI